MTHENDERLARRMGATFVPHDYDREQATRSALERWKALPEDERNGERPWIMGFNAGWEAALEAQPAPAEDALRVSRDVLYSNAVEAVTKLYEWCDQNETDWTGWGDMIVPPGATAWTNQAKSTLAALTGTKGDGG